MRSRSREELPEASRLVPTGEPALPPTRQRVDPQETIDAQPAGDIGNAPTLLAPRQPAGRFTPPSIPGYEILEELGRGGMGVVVAANQSRLGRRVALKLLSRDATADAAALQRFEDEARTASSLNHPHICTIFDLGAHDGQPFIVMELVTGRTLASLLDDGLPIERAVRLVRQVAEALAAAHAAGVVHRDIKPANVMVRDDGYVKVLDFGIARLIRGGGRDPSRDEAERGLLVGTPRYMSPEQVRGEPAEPPSDVFSLGIVLFELLTGRHPFAAATILEALNAVQERTPPAPSAENPAIDPDLDALVLRMLAKDPRERPTMREVVAELSRSSVTGIPAPAARVAAARTGGRWLYGILAVLVLAPLIWLAAARVRRSDGPREGPTPSILVLPFSTVGDETNAYFGAGVAEDITAMLSRAPDITVLSNSAALAYKDAPADTRRIGDELGVAYVLEGTVRKEGGKVRIVAQLIDTRTGAGMWSERFDQAGEDPWALQDKVADKIVGALTGEYGQLKRAHYRKAWGTDSTNLDEYEHYLRGHELYMRFTPADHERAGEMWRIGLAAFPDSALLETKLGFYHFMRPYLYFTADADADFARAGALVRSALAKPHLSPLEGRLAHWLFAYVSAQEGDFEHALREVEVTRSLAPYDAFQNGDLSSIFIHAARPDEAIKMLDEAMAVDAANRAFYMQLKGWALNVAGRHAESVDALKGSIDLPSVPLLNVISFVRLGRLEEAKAEVARALKLSPGMTLAKWRSANFYRDPAIIEAQLADLASAGLR